MSALLDVLRAGRPGASRRRLALEACALGLGLAGFLLVVTQLGDPGWSVSGVVSDAAGRSQAGVVVRVVCPAGHVHVTPGEFERVTSTTGRDGRFDLGQIGCLPRECEVVASREGWRVSAPVGAACSAASWKCGGERSCRRAVVSLVVPVASSPPRPAVGAPR